MRSRILTLAGLLFLSLAFFCCKKESPAVDESPFFEFFNESSIVIDTVKQSADAWEYGFVFSPLKDGKITQFSVKLPATGNFTVTLWDVSTTTPVVLGSKIVSAADINVSASDNIPEIAVKKGGKYGITVLSDAFFRITKTGGENFAFPRTIGNINILSFNEAVNNSNAPAFPATSNAARVAPCVNVIFIAD